MDKTNYSLQPYFQRVDKPWGYEMIITPTSGPVTGKLAFTKADHRWSLQYHEGKTEIICLVEGEAILTLEDKQGELKEIPMEQFKGYLVKPGQKHRFSAKTNCLTMETSTPELASKTVRVADDYNRGNESEKERKELRKNG
jgi:mannose-6-phosphate isomerase-like protein (cupin superfamily)